MKNVKWTILSCLAVIALTASVAVASPATHTVSTARVNQFAGQLEQGESDLSSATTGDSGEEGITKQDGDDSGSVVADDLSMTALNDASSGSNYCRSVIHFVCRTKDGHNWCVKATKWICD